MTYYSVSFHRQNLGWFYKRRLAIEMSKEAKHMLNRLSQYVYKCGLIRRGKGLRKLIEVSGEKRQYLGGGGVGGGAVDWNCLLFRKDCSKI